MTQYPGSDPDPNDPFAKPPNESGQGSGQPPGQPSGQPGDETGPVTPATPPPAPQSGEQGSNPWAGYGVPAGDVPPPPPPPSGQPQPPATPPPGYGPPQPYAYPVAPNHPQATTILVLGIISIVCCQIAGPFAWVMGGRARKEIQASQGRLGGDGQVTAGWIMGIIGTLFLLLAVVFVVIIAIVGVAGGFDSSTTYDYNS